MISYTSRELDTILERHHDDMRNAHRLDCAAFAGLGFAMGMAVMMLWGWM